MRPLLEPLRRFLRTESAGGIVLLACAVAAMVMANSSVAAVYRALLGRSITVGAAAGSITESLQIWINDGLMASFFLLVGLELKRELTEGHLASPRRAVLPAIAALGGMVVPAVFYVLATAGDATATRGWAIPTATDIAFALGVLSLLGGRVPASVKVLLLSIAIFDDLGAILVIAAYYTTALSLPAVVVAVVATLTLVVLGRCGVRSHWAYVLLGLVLWIAVFESGVHATLAGVVLALCIPGGTVHAGTSMLRTWERALHPWVAFGVVPLFALANAGVPLGGLRLRDAFGPVPLGVVAGLVLGKQLGVFGAIWIATRLRVTSLPAEMGWRHVHGLAILCGIGFTMSVFIASLAFPFDAGGSIDLARLGVLVGSSISALGGYVMLRRVRTRR